MTHLINKLKFEINCPGEDQAFQLRHSFQDTLLEQIIKVVDQVCSNYVPEGEWIQIDRIEIDAGSFSSHSLYTDFALAFQQKFERELIRKLSIIPSSKRQTSRQDSWIELFMHFIRTGGLPWWASEAEIDLKKISKEL
ncbi:MAG: contractile injection system tape measure protein, partial [Chitinophagaceae bacterium]